MSQKSVFLIILLFLVSISSVALAVQRVEAAGTIYIRANGSVDPSSAPIARAGSVYTFTTDINGSVVIEKSYVTLDGANFKLQGTGLETAVYMTGKSYVTVKNIVIENFFYGINLDSGSHNNTISGNKITGISSGGIYQGISVYLDGIHENCYNNTISNNMINVTGHGIYLYYSDNNVILRNNVTALSRDAIRLEESANNEIFENVITNSQWSFWIDGYDSVNNHIYHNNMISDGQPSVYTSQYWDNGYPSGGNYWSNYQGIDSKSGPYQNETGGDGIGDTPCGVDNYPLMEPFVVPEFLSFLILPLFMIATLLAVIVYKKRIEKRSSTFAF
jgi:parallel beta-helix repeat protein